jgi:hypothetical protein
VGKNWRRRLGWSGLGSCELGPEGCCVDLAIVQQMDCGGDLGCWVSSVVGGYIEGRLESLVCYRPGTSGGLAGS